MFNNIGGKIKGFAQVVCWLGIIGSVIIGLAFFNIGIENENGRGIAFLGFVIAIGGSIMSWLGSFLTYGFGQLVENSDKLVKQSNTPISSNPIENLSTATKQNKPSWHPVSESAAIIIGETNIKCANCHRIQFKGNKTCTQCGARFTEIKQQ